MAPRVLNSKKSFELNNPNKDEYLKVKNDLLRFRKYVEKNFEFVGDKFADKVRQVYYDKNTKKNIYGTTTSKEREELREEGINLISVPWVEKDN